jgi:hypothetical protein
MIPDPYQFSLIVVDETLENEIKIIERVCRNEPWASQANTTVRAYRPVQGIIQREISRWGEFEAEIEADIQERWNRAAEVIPVAAEMLDNSVSAIAPKDDHAKYGDFEGEGAADPWKAAERYFK